MNEAMNETKSGVARLLSAAILLGVVTIAGCGAPDGSADDVAVKTDKLDLTAPFSLWPGQSLWSDNGLYRLTMQSDCNLVLYAPNAIWSSNTYNGGTYCNAAMQTDGNFVVYNGTRALWESHTWGHPGAYVEMQNDRNLVVYDQNRRALWASNTWLPPAQACYYLVPHCPNPPPACSLYVCNGKTVPVGPCGSCTF